MQVSFNFLPDYSSCYCVSQKKLFTDEDDQDWIMQSNRGKVKNLDRIASKTEVFSAKKVVMEGISQGFFLFAIV